MKKKIWVTNILKRKVKNWLTMFVVIFLLLFCFRFTYWQDTGIGDNNSIPVGYEQTVENEDFESTYFQPSENDTALPITNYSVVNNILCAEVNHDFTGSPSFDYFTYDLATNKLKIFNNKDEYVALANNTNLPLPPTFNSFETHFELYLKHKSFWRKWMVP